VDTVVVYKANPESLQKILGLLRKEGFNPTTLDNRVSAADLHGAGRATYLISVAVPRDEAAGARSLLNRWDKARQTEVDAMERKLAGPFILSAMIVGALAVVLLALQVLGDAVALLAVAWIVLFAVLANVERITLNTRNTGRSKRR
jgi:hypothetical protein